MIRYHNSPPSSWNILGANNLQPEIFSDDFKNKPGHDAIEQDVAIETFEAEYFFIFLEKIFHDIS